MINYIIKALLDGDSISINDLGTFTKQYQSARFEDDTMLPPQYIVNLIVQDDQPDGTEFIDLLCREKQCRITEAAAEISRWVEELKTALENNKSVSFDNFGTFSLNNKGAIQFVCDHINEINREFEGMSVVKLGETGTGAEVGEEDELVNEVQEVQRVQEVQEVQEVKEKEERRLQEEAEQRLREAEEQERLAKEAEERRLQEEAEQRLREAEAEEKRLQEEAEQRLREAEAEEKRMQEEAEQRLRETETVETSHCGVSEEPETETTESIETENIEPVDKDKQTEDEPTDEVTEPKKHRSLWWLFVLLILIALGVLGYLFRQQLLTVFNNLKEKITAPKEAVVTEEPETVAEDTIAYEEAIEEDTLAEPEVYTPEVVRTTANGNYPVIRFEQGHYYVIAGSLPSEQDAVRHIKQRNLDQYEPKLVMQNGVANLRVCIGIFDTEEEAENFAKNINPKYWVLK